MIKYLLGMLFYISVSFTMAQTATQPSGRGTEVSPYLINTLENLYWITQNTDKWWNVFYKQTADIDASSTNKWSWDDGSKNKAVGFKSIGDNVSGSFNGTYDGQGFSIDGLYIRRYLADHVGLFGNTWEATLININLTNVNITSYYGGNQTNIGFDFIGALAGTSNGSTIRNCHSSGSVSGGGAIGGLVGYIIFSDHNDTNMDDCSSTCTVSGVNWIGGLVGINNGSFVNNCYSTGSVTGSTNIQGENSYSSGGLIGKNMDYATVTMSYSSGTVTGEFNVGGFIGNNSDAIVENCFSTGNTSGSASIGGLIGYSSFDINEGVFVENCYSIGHVSGIDKVGGLIGQKLYSDVVNCFWDTETSRTSLSASGTGKTTSQMQTETTFTKAGWNFKNIWQMNGYPDFTSNPLPVELTSFTVRNINNKIELEWETATEVNNYGFEIERKYQDLSIKNQNEKRSWETISFIEGHGNSNSPKRYSLVDEKVSSGKYLYRLKQIDIDGSFEYSKTIEVDLGLPMEFELSQNFPNPFNPTTKIKYSIPNVASNFSLSVVLKVYDILGKEVATIVNQKQNSGNYEATFEGNSLASGTYIYKLQVGDFTEIKKMMLVK
ncbi:MAG: GLUG motif-containing protein [Melioribacteraceae bacterium]